MSMACECSVTDIATDWRNANVVFKGRVVSVTTGTDSFRSLKVVMLQADKVYKGSDTKSVFTILTSAYGASCGVIFEVGKDYIVFGSKKPYWGRDVCRNDAAMYIADQCSGTEYWSEDYEHQLFGLK